MNSGLSIDEDDLNTRFSVTIQGIRAVVETLDKEDIQMQMNLEGLGEGSHAVTVKVKEDNFTVVNLSPESFQIRIRRN